MTNYEIHPKTRKSRSAPKKKIENRMSLYNKGPAQVNEKRECGVCGAGSVTIGKTESKPRMVFGNCTLASYGG